MFAGCNSVRQLANLDDVPAQYIHPTTKQCNYTPNLSNVNAAKLQGYTYAQIIANASGGYVIRYGNVTKSTGTGNDYVEQSISYSGFSAVPSILATASYEERVGVRRVTIAASIACDTVTTTGATFTIFPRQDYVEFSNADIRISWIAIGI